MTATPPMLDHPWLDTQRFAARRFLPSVLRSHLPLNAGQLPDPGWTEGVRQALAERLRRADGAPVDADDVLLCGSDREAIDLTLGRLLHPDAVALVAEPADPMALLAILGNGARYLDVGRRDDAAVDRAGVERATALHPQSVAWVEAPSLLHDADLDAWSGSQVRAVIADLRQSPWPLVVPAVAASIVALRDPDQPDPPVLHAVVTAAGLGPGLGLLHGQPTLPEAQLRHADAVLQGNAADDHAEARARWTQAWHAAIGAWPGVVPLGQLGWRASVLCLAGDAAQLADHLARQWPSWRVGVRAYPPHPGRSALVLNLAAMLRWHGTQPS